MDSEKLTSVVSRLLLAAGFVLLALAVAERVAYQLGYTILHGTLSGGRLLEIAVACITFVIALLLRQIREELRRQRP